MPDSMIAKGMIRMSNASFRGFLVVLRSGSGGHFYSRGRKRFNAWQNDVTKSWVDQDCQDEAIIEGLQCRSPPLILPPTRQGVDECNQTKLLYIKED